MKGRKFSRKPRNVDGCGFCYKKSFLPYHCKFCSLKFCIDHQLPENHRCKGLKKHGVGIFDRIFTDRSTPAQTPDDEYNSPEEYDTTVIKKDHTPPVKTAILILAVLLFFLFYMTNPTFKTSINNAMKSIANNSENSPSTTITTFRTNPTTLIPTEAKNARFDTILWIPESGPYAGSCKDYCALGCANVNMIYVYSFIDPTIFGGNGKPCRCYCS